MKENTQGFSHLNDAGDPAMVDVSEKKVTRRTATARAHVILGIEITADMYGRDIQTAKGPVFQTAILAGTMAAKKTGDLIPLCHPIGLEDLKITIDLTEDLDAVITCTAINTGKTGVEMEALTGVTVAALTIYDMCKAISHNITITDVFLIEKTGGKRDFTRKV